jgi:hypothetical protein
MQFKQRVFRGVAVATVGAFMIMASDAHATKIVLDYGSHHSGIGGEFVVKSDGSAASTAFVNATKAHYSPLAIYSGGFETFCLEYNEHFSPGSSYEYQVSPGAIKGGNTASDPVSVGTAYLYGLFAQGSLASYNYSSSTSAGNLQNTIWFLEGERNGLPAGPLIANPGTFDSLLIAQFGSVAVAQMDSAMSTSYGLVNAASFGVAALNLGGGTKWPNQDQLVYSGGYRLVPDGGTTLMLFGVAVGGLSLLRRKLA